MTLPSLRTGRRMDRASGTASSTISASPTIATPSAISRVRDTVDLMSARSLSTTAATLSVSEPSSSSVAWLRSAISSSRDRTEAELFLAASAKSVMNWLNATKSGRLPANVAAMSAGSPAATTASAASTDDCTSSVTSPVTSWPSAAR
jgi:hypothetical protein